MATIPPEKFINAVLTDYVIFKCIERTLHIEDIQNKNEITLKTSEICEDDKSRLMIGVKVLWFKVSSPENENHFYGNVSFSINMKTFLEYFCSEQDYKMHWIEKVLWDKSIDSRLLLTKNPISIAQGCPFGELGYPIYKDDFGIFYELKNLTGFQYNQNIHEVEFVIEATDEDSLWLFQHCDRVPVNHSKANCTLENGRYVPKVCHKYNSSRRAECPTPYSIKQTEKIMEAIHFKKIIHPKIRDGESHTSELMEMEPENISVDTFSKVYLSFETGGLRPQDGILQISVACDDYKYSTYVTPEATITEGATEKHGLINRNHILIDTYTNTVLKTVSVKEALRNILRGLNKFHSCMMIVHELQFKKRFLDHFVNRSDLKESYSKTFLGYVDVKDIFKKLERDKTYSYSLNSISDRWIPHIKYNDSNSDSKVTCLNNLLSWAYQAGLTNEMLLNSSISIKYINYQKNVKTHRESLNDLLENNALSSLMANKMSKIGINYMFLKKAFESGLLSEQLSMIVEGKPRITKDKKIIRKITNYFEEIVSNDLEDKTFKMNIDISE